MSQPATLIRQPPSVCSSTLIKMVREEGAGVLVATHNLALTRHMDRVLTLKDGKLVDYTE